MAIFCAISLKYAPVSASMETTGYPPAKEFCRHMKKVNAITEFYRNQLPDGELKNNILHAPCPFCVCKPGDKAGLLLVFLRDEDRLQRPLSGLPLFQRE
jgi:hypothetical protein